MPLAALDMLARTIVPWLAAFACFDVLVVDYPGAGRGFAPYRLVAGQQQGMVE